ncbi:osmotically-inducible protein OsmY [Mucilaginibacter gracilis]|uniref:Osmotically-inducible protein OsmY n=1 Tax=Mucilaginibacter gracilis TaxID=423350 RepID=A0A495J7H4_9SPHI|nr:BON domain-containing protein [Mucilaginibacter gracilis]RKR84693.1 osmotically-inducible protein OsmY [Mucilaginibacter gracilis]
MKTNQDLKTDVENALLWEPLLHTAKISVIADDGIITLAGTVDSYAKKSEAEDAAKKVAGVKVIIEQMEVVLNSEIRKTDQEIAREILSTLAASWVPADKLKIKVEHGVITLEGTLQWNFQKQAATKSLKNITGITKIKNMIVIKADTPDEVEKKHLQNALKLNWAMNGQDVRVEVHGKAVTLSGVVNSYYQKEEAERIAWQAPGVNAVKNDLALDLKD